MLDKKLEEYKGMVYSFLNTLTSLEEASDYKGFTSWDTLFSFKEGSIFWALATDGSAIKNVLFEKNEDVIKFITTLRPLQSFEKQWHDCEEECEVLDGILSDKTTKETVLKGQKALYPKYRKHTPFNPSEDELTRLIVEFKNPNK